MVMSSSISEDYYKRKKKNKMKSCSRKRNKDSINKNVSFSSTSSLQYSILLASLKKVSSAYLSSLPSASPTTWKQSVQSLEASWQSSQMLSTICEDDATFKYKNNTEMNCSWVRTNNKCNLYWENRQVSQFCPESCNICFSKNDCHDDTNYNFLNITGLSCEWVRQDREKSGDTCSFYDNQLSVAGMCPYSCGLCRSPSSTPAQSSQEPTLKLGSCNDDPNFRYLRDPSLDCTFVKKNPSKLCQYTWLNKPVMSFCALSCNKCENDQDTNLSERIREENVIHKVVVKNNFDAQRPSSTDSPKPVHLSSPKEVRKTPNKEYHEKCEDQSNLLFGIDSDFDCNWIEKEKETRCNIIWNKISVAEKCPLTCGICSPPMYRAVRLNGKIKGFSYISTLIFVSSFIICCAVLAMFYKCTAKDYPKKPKLQIKVKIIKNKSQTSKLENMEKSELQSSTLDSGENNHTGDNDMESLSYNSDCGPFPDLSVTGSLSTKNSSTSSTSKSGNMPRAMLRTITPPTEKYVGMMYTSLLDVCDRYISRVKKVNTTNTLISDMYDKAVPRAISYKKCSTCTPIQKFIINLFVPTMEDQEDNISSSIPTNYCC